jgi:hypothetical protein
MRGVPIRVTESQTAMRWHSDLAHASELGSDTPAGLDPETYSQIGNEIHDLGSATSSIYTKDRTQFQQQTAIDSGNSLSSITRLFAELKDIQVLDPTNTCEPCCPTDDDYNLDPNGNPMAIADPSWHPLLSTPSFAKATSGDSTFTSVAAAILMATIQNPVSGSHPFRRLRFARVRIT